MRVLVDTCVIIDTLQPFKVGNFRNSLHYLKRRENSCFFLVKILLENKNTCGRICVGYNCNALQFWSGRKLFGPPQAGRISRHFYYYESFGGINERTQCIYR